MNDASPAPVVSGVPEGALDLLVRAALAPEADAREAWHQWRRGYDIDTTPWNEVRLLGAVARRIDWLEPDAAIRPRIHGIRKFLWVQSQYCLTTARSGLQALQRAGVPGLMLKGMARIVREPAATQERLIRDIDVLVPITDRARAGAALEADGWVLREDVWQMRLHTLDSFSGHHAWTWVKDKATIDLHHFSNYLNRLNGDDDAMWQRARPMIWNGIEVHIPAPADALLTALIHGVRWSTDRAADWAIDAAYLLDREGVDWLAFLQETRRRGVQSLALLGLTYLRDALKRDVPSDVLRTLEAECTDEQKAERDSYVTSMTPDTQEGLRAMASMAISRAARRAGTTSLGKPGQRKRKRIRHFTFTLNAGETEFWVEVPVEACDGDWLIVTFVIELSRDPGEHAFAKFRVPGLGLGTTPVPMRESGSERANALFRLRIPKAFFALRGISLLGFEHMSLAGEEAFAYPRRITIEWFSVD